MVVDRPGGLDAIPPDFNGRLLEEDWDRLEEVVRNAQRRVPALRDVRVTKLINGPEAFTPDGEFCLGETEVGGLFARPASAPTGWRARAASAR